MLLDDIIKDSRWDMTYLGMQIMVEGLALAAFGFMHMLTEEPLLKQLLRYVMSDEARHVAFGVLSLKEYYDELTDAEMRERQEFAFEAAVRMRDRFLQQEVWERMGVPVEGGHLARCSMTPEHQMFQQMLFSKIVPNCKKLGLLDASDGWLRQKFDEIGVIQFEDWADTGEEYDTFALAEGRPAVPSLTRPPRTRAPSQEQHVHHRRRHLGPHRCERSRRHPGGRQRAHPRDRSTRCRTTPRPSSRGTTRRARDQRSTSSTRRPRRRSGTATPTSTGRSTSTTEKLRHRGHRSNPLSTSSTSTRHAASRSWERGRVGRRSTSRCRTGRCSQFMHGEQGALICTAKIVETVPWIDAKYYAATQVMDEARHVEVFAKYLDAKLLAVSTR